MRILTTSDLCCVSGGEYENKADSYNSCNWLQTGLETAADAIPSTWLSEYAAILAQEVGNACRLAVTNYTNLVNKSPSAISEGH